MPRMIDIDRNSWMDRHGKWDADHSSAALHNVHPSNLPFLNSLRPPMMAVDNASTADRANSQAEF